MRRPRSHSGYVRFAMENLGLTYGKAMEYADARLEEKGRGQRSNWDEQDSLFEDSERTKAASGGDHPPQEGARQRPPSAPGYDPRSAPWPEDY